MYHRVAAPAADIWDIAVSPENFEQHLKILRKKGNVQPLRQLVAELRDGKLQKNSIAITFDDGYIDNFAVAKPLLEQYGLPATFFITSGNIGKDEEFWWEELEHILLFTPKLPQTFSAEVGEGPFTFDLQAETHLTVELRQRHIYWNACDEAPPTRRAELFLALWQQLKPLPYIAQKELLGHIRDWAGVPVSRRAAYRSMTAAQLQEMGRGSLFDIGAHTVTHAALGMHRLPVQEQELRDNRQYLTAVTGADIPLLAYPYGNYNSDTLAAAVNTGFAAAFTTEEKAVKKRSSLYRLGRLQVKNLPGQAFAAQLDAWQHKL